jgi:cellulose synthase/poly-beta-1,6-N-acetylglucosamine synthase-like glycosyltransferase
LSVPPLFLSQQYRVDPDAAEAADARALDRIGLETALRNQVLPLLPAGIVTPVAAPSLAAFHRMEPHLRALVGPVVCRLWPAERIEATILELRRAYLARRAELRTPPEESCRVWSPRRFAAGALAVTAALAAGILLRADAVVTLVALWTGLTLAALTGLRTVAAVASLRRAHRANRDWRSTRARRTDRTRLPRISLLVPLYDERDIAGRLVARLARLDYPRDRLEVCLVLEWGDLKTEAALRCADLPGWMRIVQVPRGALRTKPRAMNYALDFLSGDVIGVYDAEDRPAPDQLLDVADALVSAGPEVACVQGVLDFYNARANWLTRCFAIDYAVWFRLVLPGLERLGVVVPLGGTTVFFRRAALEALGRWDAHNVTEDADLGLRLARRGYRCLFVHTVTEEEATSSVPAWVRQRSRWIKGYAMTWAVHMRDPLRLLGELGWWRFLGVQVLFLGTLSQFVLAPFLWSFWLILFGLPHPATAHLPHAAVVALAVLFFVSEVATMAAAALAVAAPNHRWLIKWVPLLHIYFPLASVASWKGLGELAVKPFFWDKTRHGMAAARRMRAPG